MQPALPSPKAPLSSHALPKHRTAGRSRFPLRLALSERRKGGEIGGLDQSDSVARHLSEAWQTWQRGKVIDFRCCRFRIPMKDKDT